MGDIERVVSWIDYIDGIIDSPAAIMWKHKDGMKYGMCEYTYGNELAIPSKYYGNDEWIEISGTKGVIIINRCTGLLKEGPSVSMFNGEWKHFETPDDWVEGFKGSTVNFINSILGREKPLLSAEDGRYILKFGIAIQKSNRLHREVYMNELDSKFPMLVACLNRARHVFAKMPKKNIFELLGIGGNTEQYAPKAKELTEELARRFNPAAAEGWSTVMGLQLTAEGGAPSMKFTMRVSGGKAELIEGSLPDDAVFTISASAGTWAAILLKKKKVEMAFMQGKLKIQGKSEEALKLKSAFEL
jgi:putative sterol carrier protein